MRLRWTTPAREDLTAILDYIAEENPAAALDVLDQIDHATQQLASFPLSGRMGIVEGTRELVIPGLPYVLIYRTPDAGLDILRLLHAARQWPPG